MGVNSTEVSYGFGQMGSVLIAGTAAVTSNGVTAVGANAADPAGANAVFCAITFLEDSKFASSAGLVSTDNDKFVNSDSLQTAISGNTAVTNGEVFPKGLTIYGRWTKINLATGKVIAYIGY
jgi:hypothetical protein